MAKKQQKLVSPDGTRSWVPEDAVQATNLRAAGWRPAPAEAPKAPAKQTKTTDTK